MTTAFWIASGSTYIQEARESAASLKQHNPHIDTVLLGSEYSDGFSDNIPLPPRGDEPWYLYSTRQFVKAVNEIVDSRLLYFDTDTRILANLEQMIDLIHRFDFIGAHAPARETARPRGYVPDAFPEINIGVIGLQNTSSVRRMLADWLKRYQTNTEHYGDNDQAPLREALWNSTLSVYILPPEYNCRFGFGGFAALPVKVLHNRGYNFERAAEYLNGTAGMRVWRGSDLP